MAKGLRKNNFVDAKIQGTLFLRAVCHWTFLMIGTFVVLVVWQVFVGDPHHSLADHVLGTWSRYAPCFIIMLILLPIVVHDTLKISHRLAGPLLRLRQSMQSLAERRPVPPVRFRTDDFCQDLAANFNILLERLQSQDGPGASEAEDCGESPLASIGDHSSR